MELIKLSEISGKIMTLMDEAETTFVAVSPYIKLAQWEKMKNRLRALKERGVSLEFFVRANEAQSVSELARLGLNCSEVKNLHCKVYFNDKYAIVTSQNLLQFSDANSIEIAFQTQTTAEYLEIVHYVDKNVRSEVVAPQPKEYLTPKRVTSSSEAILESPKGGTLDSLIASIGKLTKVKSAHFEEDNLIVKTERFQYQCFVWHGKSLRLRLKCSLSTKDYSDLKRRSTEVRERNFYTEIEFQEPKGNFPPVIWGTGVEDVDFTSVQELIVEDYSRLQTRLYYFVASIETGPGIFA